jgi:hypothetical protein
MGFVDTFRELYPGKIKYSFWDIRDKSRKENKGWRLDYFLVSKQIMNAVVDAEIHNEFWGSDHCPVSLTIDVSKIDLEEFREYQRMGEQEADADAEKDELDMDDPLNEERKSDLEDDLPIDDEEAIKFRLEDDVGDHDGSLEEDMDDDEDRIDDPERELA